MTDPATRTLLNDLLLGPSFRRATFGGVQRGSGYKIHPPGPPLEKGGEEKPIPVPPLSKGGPRWISLDTIRVVVRPVELRGERHLQFEAFDRTQATAKNARTPAEIAAHLDDLLAIGFAGIHVETESEAIDIRLSKKGKVLVGRRSIRTAIPPSAVHNRVKDVPLPEGTANRLLEVMGILTRDGTVRPTMRAKFTQINEFLKHLRHVLEAAGLRGLDRPLTILDCGCGASHLTLATHYYLNDVLGIPAQLLGIDVNDDLIRKSTARAAKLDGVGPNFLCGPIGNAGEAADIVIALHACDTATDDALARAVLGSAKLLLAVPCCHHALNAVLRATGEAEACRPMLRPPILHERMADILTDTFRALALRVMGYRTEIVEFVSPEHTARNLMIRAVRGAADATAVAEYRALKQFWGVTPHIETVLGEPFQRAFDRPISE